MTKTQDCPKCYGRGDIVTWKHNPNGLDKGTARLCPKCGGKGQVSVKERA